MATAHVDRIDNLSLTHDKGIVTSLKRQVVVSGLATGSYKALFEALDACGIAIGDAAGTSGEYTSYNLDNVFCFRRQVRTMDSTKGIAVVDLEYAHWSTFKTDEFLMGGEVNNQTISWSGGTNVSQVNSVFDYFGNTITVEHTYPADDPDYPSMTLTQGGQIQAYEPQTTLQAECLWRITFPDLNVSRRYVGAVNGTAWKGDAPYTWLCTGVDFSSTNIISGQSYFNGVAFPGAYGPEWKFIFMFQFNPDGWNPWVVFTDARTGKPPVDLIYDTGYRQVAWYAEMNFGYPIPYFANGAL